MNYARLHLPAFALAVAVHATHSSAAAAPIAEAISTVRGASPTAATSDEVRQAWRVLAAAEPKEIPMILRGMLDSNPAVENWLRSAVDAIVDGAEASGTSLPKQGLTDLLNDLEAAPRARRVAYELLAQIDEDEATAMLSGMISDPSLEIRYDAIAQALSDLDSGTEGQNAARYKELLRVARDLDQIEACKLKLEEAGEDVDLARLLGFVTSWRLCGLFDNTDESGFDVAYPPEATIDFAATYEGKDGSAEWRSETTITDDELALLDLNEVIGAKKGAVAYAYAEFDASKAGKAQLRYASKNATKLWLNNELVAANEVYHAGSAFDQYVVDVKLMAGKNTLLLKVCQNEQTQPWAQDWTFQLRVTDELGGAIEFEASELTN